MIDKLRQAEIHDDGFQIRHAVLDSSTPVQNPGMKFRIGGYIAAVGIDARGGGRSSAGDGVADLAGDGDRPDPGQRIRKIAKAFAEIDIRDVGVERLRADIRSARATPLDAEADGHHELMFGVLEDPIFEGGVEVLESIGSRYSWIDWAQEGVGRAERDREILGDPLGKFRGNIALPRRRFVAGMETVDRRQRHFVVDAGIVDAEGSRKKAIADYF